MNQLTSEWKTQSYDKHNRETSEDAASDSIWSAWSPDEVENGQRTRKSEQTKIMWCSNLKVLGKGHNTGLNKYLRKGWSPLQIIEYDEKSIECDEGANQPHI